MRSSARPLNGVRVLLVEDHEDTRLTAEACLDQEGALVTATSSAQQALLALTKERFDVVITDYSMPERSGRWLLDRIGELPSPTPVIVLTGYAQAEVEELGRAPFARAFRKPIDYDRLCDEILAVLREQRGRSSST